MARLLFVGGFALTSAADSLVMNDMDVTEDGLVLLQVSAARSTLAKEKVCTLVPGKGCAPKSQGGASLGPPSRGVDENACQARCIGSANCEAAFTFRNMCLQMSSCPPVTLSGPLASAKMFKCEDAPPPPPATVAAVGDPHITSVSGHKFDLALLDEKTCKLRPGTGCAPQSQGGKSLGPPSRGVDENACQANCIANANCEAAFTFRNMCLQMSSCPPVTLSRALASAKVFTCEATVAAVGDPHISSVSGHKFDLEEDSDDEWFFEADDSLLEDDSDEDWYSGDEP